MAGTSMRYVGGVKYVQKALSTGTKTFAQKIADLSSAFSALSFDEKVRSVLIQDNSAVFHYNGGTNGVYFFNSNTNVMYQFNTQRHLTQTSTGWQEDSSTSNSANLALCVLETI